jgi:hypothetical protein
MERIETETPAQYDAEKARPPSQKENVIADQELRDPEIEKRVVRKMDKRLVPLVMALCMF